MDVSKITEDILEDVPGEREYVADPTTELCSVVRINLGAFRAEESMRGPLFQT